MSIRRVTLPLFVLPLVLSALVLGCPESAPITDVATDLGTTVDEDVAGSPEDTATEADVGADAGSEADTPTAPDTATPEPDVAPGVDTTPVVECVVDDDCYAVLGPKLTACQVPLCEEGKCSPDGKPDGGECDDGDACTGPDKCTKGVCIGTPLDCDDDNACTTDSCDAFIGECTHAPLTGDSCDDGDICSGPDLCKDGACTTTPGTCPGCTVDDDCKALDDGNACNGKVGCVDGICGLLPGTVIDCSGVTGGACNVAVCDPTLGACALVDAVNGTPCTPSSQCQVSGVCSSGKCVGPEIVCDDKNPCTIDICDTAKGCTTKPATGPCDDGNACTKNDACTNGACVGVALVDCDDKNPCTADGCDPATNTCSHTPVDGTCSDADQCTSEACVSGSCVSTPVSCNDGDACTTDSCSPALGCTNAAIVCDDNNPCTTDACAKGQCAFTPLACGDNDPCTTDACVPGTGCVNTAMTCNDKNACTTDACVQGECIYSAISCNDGSSCTTDVCDQKLGCTTLPVNCADNDACTVDSCDPVKGCQHLSGPSKCSVDSDCNDGDPCTYETCTGACGTCEAKPYPCFDGDPCTLDTCVTGVGCKFVPTSGIACDDGDKCTTGEMCSSGLCTGGLLTCDLGTIDNPAPGCLSIKQLYPTKPSGKYWLKPGATTATFEAWCDMTINTGGSAGGFTRIGVIGGEIAICGLTPGIGTTDAVASAAAGSAVTAFWPGELVSQIPFSYREIVVVFDTGFYVFSSGNGAFSWAAIAAGTIHSANIGTYQVYGSKNGGKTELIAPAPISAGLKGGGLIGGLITGGTSPFLGVGAMYTGSFTNDAACGKVAGHNGVYRSTLFAPAAWGGKAMVYVR